MTNDYKSIILLLEPHSGDDRRIFYEEYVK